MRSHPSGAKNLLASTLLILLLVAMTVGLAANTSKRLFTLGEWIWPGYASELRAEPAEPECSLEELEQQASTCTDAEPSATDDPFDGKDPFADPGAAPAPSPADDDPFDGEDPFADAAPAPEPADDPFDGEDPFAEAAPTPKPATDDPFDGEDPFAQAAPAPEPAAGDDPFAGEDPFATAPSAPAVQCGAVRALSARCEARWEDYDSALAARTGTVVAFAAAHSLVTDLVDFPYSPHLLVLVVLVGGLASSVDRTHLALRDPRHPLEYRIALGAQLLAWTVWLLSALADWRVQSESLAESSNAALPVLWAVGFAVLWLDTVRQLVRPPSTAADAEFSLVRAIASIPLFAWMALIAAVWFLGAETHVSGQAIQLHKFTGIPSIYLGIGLYIWAGMLLAQTRLAARVFDVLAPFDLPPALLAWAVVVLAALPTAYSGASGIFVIAAGAVIFERLRAVGASHRTALGATAMSGSLGVVLRPCLVVVLVSVLDSDVTTDELFGWGLWVFALTAGLYLLAMLWRNDQPIPMPTGKAVGGAVSALRPLIPAALLVTVALLGFWLFLGTVVTEHTAAFVLPGVMLLLAVVDLRQAGQPLWPALRSATAEASHHIGALLFVMAGSVGIGGVVERSEVMEALPADLGGPFPAMALLLIAMVLIGMTMDALGAVILVSVSLTQVAENNGIGAAHFWMMVLCAFELGYLTPPVALNHLLARQVIGPGAEPPPLPNGSFFERHEHLLIPMGVMATALLLVAFVPLIFDIGL